LRYNPLQDYNYCVSAEMSNFQNLICFENGFVKTGAKLIFT